VPFKWMDISGVLRLSYEPSVGGDRLMRLLIRDAHVGIVPVSVSMAIEAILARLGWDDRAEIGLVRIRRPIFSRAPW
jgi:hypothetical protein